MMPSDNPNEKYTNGEKYTNNGDKMSITECIPKNPTGDPDFDTHIHEYKDMLLATNLKPSTALTNYRFLKVAFDITGKDPHAWNDLDLQNLVLSEKYQVYMPRSKRAMRYSLKSYWRVFNVVEMLPPNHYQFWHTKDTGYGGGTNKYDENKRKSPTVAEGKKVRDICRDVILNSDNDDEIYRHMALYITASYGLRKSEVANLRVCDIHIDQEYLHVEEGKGDKSRDVWFDVPLTPELWDRFMAARSSIVNRLRAEDSGRRFIAKYDALLDDRAAPLFFYRQGDTVGDQSSPNALGAMVERLGSHILGRGPKDCVNPHAWRHFKSFEAVGTMDIHLAAKYLGHANIQMTQDYINAGVEEMKAAYKVGKKTPAPKPVAAPSNGALDAAVSNLTAALTKGDLSPEVYAAAVAALTGGK